MPWSYWLGDGLETVFQLFTEIHPIIIRLQPEIWSSEIKAALHRRVTWIRDELVRLELPEPVPAIFEWDMRHLWKEKGPASPDPKDLEGIYFRLDTIMTQVAEQISGTDRFLYDIAVMVRRLDLCLTMTATELPAGHPLRELLRPYLAERTRARQVLLERLEPLNTILDDTRLIRQLRRLRDSLTQANLEDARDRMLITESIAEICRQAGIFQPFTLARAESESCSGGPLADEECSPSDEDLPRAALQRRETELAGVLTGTVGHEELREFREFRNRCRILLGPFDRLTFHAHGLLADAFTAAGRPDEAGDVLHDAFKTAVHHLGDRSTATLEVFMVLVPPLGRTRSLPAMTAFLREHLTWLDFPEADLIDATRRETADLIRIAVAASILNESPEAIAALAGKAVASGEAEPSETDVSFTARDSALREALLPLLPESMVNEIEEKLRRGDH